MEKIFLSILWPITIIVCHYRDLIIIMLSPICTYGKHKAGPGSKKPPTRPCRATWTGPASGTWDRYSGGRLTAKLLCTLDIEDDYLPHVVACENDGAGPEALRAQAVAARSYAYYKIGESVPVTDGQGD